MSVSFSTITQKARLQPQAATTAAMRRALTYIPPTTTSALKNGVKISAEENPNAKFATVGLWLDVGTKNETRQSNGILHVLNEANFQGTSTHPDRKALAAAIDDIGGHLMTKVGREHSYVAVKVARENVQKAVGILTDVVRNNNYTDATVSEAKVLAEKRRQQSDELVDDLVMDNLHICAYDATQDGGLGLSVNGSEAGIANVTPATLREFKAKQITGPRMSLIGAGAVKHSELEQYAQQFLGDMDATNNKSLPCTRYVGGDYRLWNLRMKTAHLAFAFETMGAASGDVLALELATHIFGNFHRSQHELGNHAIHRTMKVFSSMDFGTPTNTPMPEQGIESVTSFYEKYEDSGLAGMVINCRPWQTGPGWAGNLQDYLQYTMLEWARLAQKMVQEQELDQAKVNMKSQLLFNQDGSTNSFEDIGKQVQLYGRRVPLEELFARVDDITPTNTWEVLQHYYYARRPVVSMYGYIYLIPDYCSIGNWWTSRTGGWY